MHQGDVVARRRDGGRRDIGQRPGRHAHGVDGEGLHPLRQVVGSRPHPQPVGRIRPLRRQIPHTMRRRQHPVRRDQRTAAGVQVLVGEFRDVVVHVGPLQLDLPRRGAGRRLDPAEDRDWSRKLHGLGLVLGPKLPALGSRQDEPLGGQFGGQARGGGVLPRQLGLAGHMPPVIGLGQGHCGGVRSRAQHDPLGIGLVVGGAQRGHLRIEPGFIVHAVEHLVPRALIILQPVQIVVAETFRRRLAQSGQLGQRGPRQV